eukprot:scaffold7378_cov410-Prasinococcus_capsulatus_cf.AAC.6
MLPLSTLAGERLTLALLPPPVATVFSRKLGVRYPLMRNSRVFSSYSSEGYRCKCHSDELCTTQGLVITTMLPSCSMYGVAPWGEWICCSGIGIYKADRAAGSTRSAHATRCRVGS